MPCGFATCLENLIAVYLKCSQFHKVNDSKMGCLLKVNVSGVPAPNLHSQAMSGLGAGCSGQGYASKQREACGLRKSPLSGRRGRSLETSKDVCV